MQKVFVCLGISLAALAAYGQQMEMQSEAVECMGTVQPSDSGAIAVELDGGMGMHFRAEVDGSGFFRLSRVPAGEYVGRVVGSSGITIYSTTVSVRVAMPPVVFRLPEMRPESQAWGTVSVARLQHKVPAKAVKEMELAERATKKNDTNSSIDHLRKAIAIDPDYMEAHNNLGIRYIATDQGALALAELQKAIQLEPRSASLEANLAIALICLHRPAEAEKAARMSVDLNGTNPRTRYLLAVALVEQGKITPEVEKNLRAVSGEMPGAHLLLGKVLIGAGQLDAAATELEAYLASGREEERAETAAWLKNFAASRR
jgi:tetratricopeptide (TPR) repeat protein